MKKNIALITLITITASGCANQCNNQPLRPGLYGPVDYALVVPEEKMVSQNHLASQARNELIVAKQKADAANSRVHIICPESATQPIMSEMDRLGLTYDRNIKLHGGYLVIFPQHNRY